MQDNTSHEKQQAEALSAAIDGLNRGVIPSDRLDAGIEELIGIAKLVKDAGQLTVAPPQEVFDNIVKQASQTITRNKQKKRQAWRLAGVSSAVAAVLVAALLQIVPPVLKEQELAKVPPVAPALMADNPQPPVIIQAAPNIASTAPVTEQPPQAAVIPPMTGTQTVEPAAPAKQVAPVEPQSSGSAAGETMLVLADRIADTVTIDATSKTIRQIYQQGTPNEIIVTQTPKQNNYAAASLPPQPKMRMAAMLPSQSPNAASKPHNKNKVAVTINNIEVTLEGAAAEEELLSLAETLIEGNITK